MHWRPINWRALLAGMTAAAAASGLLTWAAAAGAFGRAAGGAGGWIYEYQTLIAGALALAGASATVLILSRQIRQQREQFREQVNVATAPLRLQVAEAVAEVSAAIVAATGPLNPAGEFMPPPTGADFIEALLALGQITRTPAFRTIMQFVGPHAVPKSSKYFFEASKLLAIYGDDEELRDQYCEPPDEADELYRTARDVVRELRELQQRMEIRWPLDAGRN